MGAIRASDRLTPHLQKTYCTLIAELPTHPVTVELIEVYFSEINWFTYVLERHYFDKLYNSWTAVSEAICKQGKIENLSHDMQYFPALLFQVLAVGLQFLPVDVASRTFPGIDDLSASEKLSFKYSETSMRIMTILGRHNPVVNAVETDLMRASWLKNCSRGTESWHSLGNAIRQAQELGLYLQDDIRQGAGENIEETLSRLWYDEYKRRLWTTLFNWDSHMALILSRPRIINANDCTIKLPIDCDIPDQPSHTVPIAGQHTPSSYSTRLCQYRISQKIHEMLSLGACKRHIKDYSIVEKLHQEIESLVDDLPPVLRPKNVDVSWDTLLPNLPCQRQQIRAAANTFLMALHKQHVGTHPSSRRAAIRAALCTLEAQQRLFEMMKEHHYKCFSLSFYTIDSAVFLSATEITYPEMDHNLKEDIRRSIRQAIDRLKLLKKRSPMAKSGEQVLTRLYQMITDDSANSHRGVAFQTMDRQYSNQALQGGAVGNSDSTTTPVVPGHFPIYSRSPTEMSDFKQLDALFDETDFGTSFWMEQVYQIVDSDAAANDKSGAAGNK